MGNSIGDRSVNAPAPAPAPVLNAPAAQGAARRLEALLSMSNLPPPFKWSALVVPRLAQPRIVFDVESINALLGELDAALTNEQLKTGTETIKLSEAERAEVAKKVKEQLETAKKKAEEAKKAAEEGKVVGWCTAVFGLVGAIVGVAAAMAFTGGTLVPLAAVGLILAVQDVANMAIKESGETWEHPNGETKKLDISIGGLVDMGIDLIPKGELSDEERAQIKQGLTIGLTVAIALTMIVGGGVGITKAGKGAEGAANLAKWGSHAVDLERAAQGTGIVMDAAQGSSSIAHAVISVEVATLERDSDRARAQKAYYDALMQDIAKRMGMAQDAIREIVARFNENYDQMSASIAAINTNLRTTARNMA